MDQQPVEKVLRDVNLLLQQRHDITTSIEVGIPVVHKGALVLTRRVCLV